MKATYVKAGLVMAIGFGIVGLAIHDAGAAQTGVAISAVAPNVQTTTIEGSATITEPNGEYTLISFRRVTMPTLNLIRLTTTATAGGGAFVGDYWAANAHGIKFQLMRTQADWPNVALEVRTASGQRWIYDGLALSGDQNVWIDHVVPLNYEAGWSESTGNTTPEGWAAARANMEWVGVTTSQRGTTAQTVAVNSFELLDSVPGWEPESPPAGPEPDPEPEPDIALLIRRIRRTAQGRPAITWPVRRLGRDYRIQVSENLRDWRDLEGGDITPSSDLDVGDEIEQTDTEDEAETAAARFYRVIEL